jgi:hypothetical protein
MTCGPYLIGLQGLKPLLLGFLNVAAEAAIHKHFFKHYFAETFQIVPT